MKAIEAFKIAQKAKFEKSVATNIEHVFERIKKRAESGYLNIVNPCQSLDIEPIVERSILNNLQKKGYEVKRIEGKVTVSWSSVGE